MLITGESGTGKELVARTIHDHSARKDDPFIAVNCGAIPDNLIESELFGHEKGSFTGAVQRRNGYFEHANSGTLFLDEVTESPGAAGRSSCARSRPATFVRSAARDRSCDVRVIAATNRDPEAAVKENGLREDLITGSTCFRSRPAAARAQRGPRVSRAAFPCGDERAGRSEQSSASARSTCCARIRGRATCAS